MTEERFQNIQFQETLPGKPKGSTLVPIVILVLILLAGFTGVLATRIWDPLWSPFRPSPEKVIKKMISETEKVKTSEGKMELSMIGKNEGEIKFKLNTNGKMNKNLPEKPKFEQKFDILVSVSEKENPMGMGMKFALAGEMKGLEEKSYVKLTTVPALPFLEGSGIDLSQIKDQWIKIDEESMMNLAKEMAGEEWTPEMERMFKEKSEKEKALQKELQEKIKKVVSGKNFYLVKKEFPDEKINGVKVYHYLVSLNKNEVLETIPEFWKIMEETMLKEYGTSPTFEKEKFKKELKEFFDKVGEIDGQLWIGKKDYLLYKLEGEKTIDLSKVSQEKGTVSIKLNLEYSNFDQPVQIEPPSKSKDIKEILAPFLREYMKSILMPQRKAKDARIIADMSQVRAIAVLIYSDESSYKNLCRNFRLNKNAPESYGTDLMVIEKDIKENQGEILNLSCYGSVKSYCVIADLTSSEKGKYCIDSTGFAGEIEENLKCLGKGTLNDPYQCPKKQGPSKIELPLKETPSLFQASVLENFLRLFGK